MRSTLVRVWALPFAGVAVVIALVWATTIRGPLLRLEGGTAIWGTLTTGIAVQTPPFLVLGVLVSGLVAVFVPKDLLFRITPRSPLLAVPAASVAGMVLPGHECAPVPMSQSLMCRGLPQGAVFALLLVAPAVNPVVPVTTAVAFASSNPMMVWARSIVSLAAVIAVYWLWVGAGKAEWMEPQEGHDHGHRFKAAVFRKTVMHDPLQAGGFLVVGVAVAAPMKAVVPTGFLAFLIENLWFGIVVMALLVVLLSLCSEADTFVAASLPGVSPIAQLVLLVVGPMVNVKLFAMQSGAFGTKFVTRFMPLTPFVCIWSAAVVSAVTLGTFRRVVEPIEFSWKLIDSARGEHHASPTGVIPVIKPMSSSSRR